MHLLVLSAFRPVITTAASMRLRSQCTFWCSVLSDFDQKGDWIDIDGVSMHLLVLSAFRPEELGAAEGEGFPVSMHLLVLSAFRRMYRSMLSVQTGLNAPFGAQCFPTDCAGLLILRLPGVSMHLLVLSAFRPT